MEKIFNDFSVVGAFIGGILSFIFGKVSRPSKKT